MAKEATAALDFYSKFFSLQDQILSGNHPSIRLTKLPVNLTPFQRGEANKYQNIAQIKDASTSVTTDPVASGKSKPISERPKASAEVAVATPEKKPQTLKKTGNGTSSGPISDLTTTPLQPKPKGQAPGLKPVNPTVPKNPDNFDLANIQRLDMQKERKRIESYFANLSGSSGLSDKLGSATEMCGASFNIADALSQALDKYKHVSGLPSRTLTHSRSVSFETSTHPPTAPARRPNVVAASEGKGHPHHGERQIQVEKRTSDAKPNANLLQSSIGLVSSRPESPDRYSPTGLFSVSVPALSRPISADQLAAPIVRNNNISPVSPQPQVRPTVLSMPDKAIARWSEEEPLAKPLVSAPDHRRQYSTNGQTSTRDTQAKPTVGIDNQHRREHSGAIPLVPVKKEPHSPLSPAQIPTVAVRPRPAYVDVGYREVEASALQPTAQSSYPHQDESPRVPDHHQYPTHDPPLRPSRNVYSQVPLERSESRRVVSYPVPRTNLTEYVINNREGHIPVYDELPHRPFRAVSVRPTRIRLDRSRSPPRVYMDSPAVSYRPHRAPSPLVLYDKYGNEYIADAPLEQVEPVYESEYGRSHRPQHLVREHDRLVQYVPPVVYNRETPIPYAVAQARRLVPDRREHSVYSSAGSWYERPASRLHFEPLGAYERRAPSVVMRTRPPALTRQVLAGLPEDRIVSREYISRTDSTRPMVAPPPPPAAGHERMYAPVAEERVVYSRHAAPLPPPPEEESQYARFLYDSGVVDSPVVAGAQHPLARSHHSDAATVVRTRSHDTRQGNYA